MNEPEPIQAEFNFETAGPAQGYSRWEEERVERQENIRRTWGVPVGRDVRVTLRHFARDFTGTLRISEAPLLFDRTMPLKLHIGPVEFFSTDIEQCVVLD